MTKTIVGKEASHKTGSEIYFQTYQSLLRQKERIDRDILKLQGKFFRAISKSKGVLSIERVKYVSRLKNDITLAEAVRKCMVPNKKMMMDDILKSLLKKDLYHTNSNSFYTMVNNKLNSSKIIEKVSHGVFIYNPRSKKKSNAVA